MANHSDHGTGRDDEFIGSSLPVIMVNAVGIKLGGGVSHLKNVLALLREERPNWTIHVYGNPSVVAGLSQGTFDKCRAIAADSVVPYLWWHAWGVTREARRIGAQAILGISNQGPLWSDPPNVMYQCNSLYFDRQWLRLASPRERLDALARRCLAYAEMRHSAVILTPTVAMANMLRRWRSYPRSSEVWCVPHGVDADHFRYAPRTGSASTTQMYIVSHAGSHKGIEDAIEALATVVSAGRSVVLNITIDLSDNVSQQPYVDKLAALCGTLNIAEHVRFIGPVDDPVTVYERADIVLLPSRSEAFGLPLLEALATGTQVIASRIPAFEEIGGNAVRYFEVGNPTSLADAIIDVIESPSAECRLPARERAVSYSWREAAALVALALEYAMSAN